MTTGIEVEVGFIVEGHGDTKAVPAVFRRVAAIEFPEVLVIARDAIRVPRDKLKRAGELERTVELLARRLTGKRAILITIDTEGESPGCLGPALLERARAVHPNIPIGVALAHNEFENWLIAAAESLAGFRGLRSDLASPERPEEVKGAKEWLSDRMIGRPYRETTDQELLAKKFSIEAARRSRSFSKFCREVSRLCQAAIAM